ncbi:MAG: L-threonylcarbamoyladenylate synthase [Candidatus Woesearchaeota archaeon]
MLNFTKVEVELKKDVVYDKILNGSIFIHPTDTIYGLGCDATSQKSVQKLREIKQENSRAFPIIAPTKTWIRENCVVDKKTIEWLTKLPGPYTLILKLKNSKAIAPEVNNGMDTIAVRIPDHWIHNFCEEFGKPIITTAANKVGENFMVSLETLSTDIKGKIDFIIYEGEKNGSPSSIIDLTQDKENIKKR